MHKVSVVVPIYRVEEQLLRKCIESILCQSLEDIEVILVDDGSPDNAGQVCNEYADNDARIRVIHKSNEGVSIARNIGIDLSEAEYISFVDADDWIEKDALEVAYSAAKKYNSDIVQWTYIRHMGSHVISNNHVFKESCCLDNEQKNEYILKAIIDKHPTFSGNDGIAAGAPWAKIYNLSFLRKNKLYFVPGLSRSQDRVFNLYVYEKAERIQYIDKPYSHYVANAESAVVSYRTNVEQIYAIYLNEIRTFVLNKRINEREFCEAYDVCVCYAIQQILTQYYFHFLNKMSIFEKYKEIKRIANDLCYKKTIANVEKIRGLITKRQFAVLLAMKYKLFFFATIAMQIDSLRKKKQFRRLYK